MEIRGRRGGDVAAMLTDVSVGIFSFQLPVVCYRLVSVSSLYIYFLEKK